jgi:hypothetical protein
MTRLRQAVLAARDLDAAVARLRGELGLGEPFSDPAVAYFGLRNAVFAIGDTFLEVVSPVAEDAPAARLLAKHGNEAGYMAMFQVDDVLATRERASANDVREVFAVDFEDIVESHFHPSDLGGAIVSASEPRPAESWRWGGPGWEERSVAGRVTGIKVAVPDPSATRSRWNAVLGDTPGVTFADDDTSPGIVEIEIERDGRTVLVTPGE